MAFSPQVYGIIDQVGDRLYARQKPREEKANTVTTGAGAAITAVVSVITYLLEEGVTWLPGWTHYLVIVLGILATILRVSTTRNGITRSTIQAYKDEVARLIDEQEGPTVAHTPGPSVPTTSPDPTTSAPGAAGGLAETFDNLAKRLAGRQG